MTKYECESLYEFKLTEGDDETVIRFKRDNIDTIVERFRDFLVACTFTEGQVIGAFRSAISD